MRRGLLAFIIVSFMVTSGLVTVLDGGVDVDEARVVTTMVPGLNPSVSIVGHDQGLEEVGSPLEARFCPETAPRKALELPVAEDGGRLLLGDATHRAPAKVLLVDDDDSDGTNTTSDFNNSGPYGMDTAHVMSEALDSLGIDHDVYVVGSGNNGPTFETMANYSTIIWMFGYEWGFRPLLTLWDYWRCISFLESGGSMWFTGPFMMAYLYGRSNRTNSDNDLAADSFASKYLGIDEFLPYTWLPDPVNSTANVIMDGTESYSTRGYFEQFGDQRNITCSIVRPVVSGMTILQGDSVADYGKAFDDEPVAVAYDSGSWRVATSILDVCCINSSVDREDLVGKVMAWLGTPDLSLSAHRVMNLGVRVVDQAPWWTSNFNRGPLPTIYPFQVATVDAHRTMTIECYLENHGAMSEDDVPVEFIVQDGSGRRVANILGNTTLDPLGIGVCNATYRPNRAGMYNVTSGVDLAGDAETGDDETECDVRVAKWLDDLEGAVDDWNASEAWRLVDNEGQSASPTHAWRFSKSPGVTLGEDLVTPPVDLRFYNKSYVRPGMPNPTMIYFNLMFQGRMYGTGQDKVDFQVKGAENDTWETTLTIDGTTEGPSLIDGDFSEDWYHISVGVYLGDYVGTSVQLRLHVEKRSQLTNSWFAVDNFIVWMGDELNEPPWILGRNPDGRHLAMELGSFVDLELWAEDPTYDEPITYEWFENGTLIEGASTNTTRIRIPRDPPPDSLYQDGHTVVIEGRVHDDLEWNSTTWVLHISKRWLDTGEFWRIRLDEDVPIEIQLGSEGVGFYHLDGLDFTVTSEGSDIILVEDLGDSLLRLSNREADWNGLTEVMFRVEDEKGRVENRSISVEVRPVNDPPVLTTLDLPDATEDGHYVYQLVASDVDDPDEDVMFTVLGGLFPVSETGMLDFVPDDEHVGYHNITGMLTDPSNGTANFTVRLLVDNVNDPPSLRYFGYWEAQEDEVVRFELTHFVEDPDLLNPPPFTDTITYRDDSTKIETDPVTGIVTWTRPTREDEGFNYFNITVMDASGAYAQQELIISIEVDWQPDLLPIVPQKLTQGIHFLYTVRLNYDFHHLYGDLIGSTDVRFSNTPTGLFTIDPVTGVIDIRPGNDHVGTWNVDIIVTMWGDESFSMRGIFEVVNLNDAPQVEPVSTREVLFEHSPYTFFFTARDGDMGSRLVDGTVVDPEEALTFGTSTDGVTIDPITGEVSFTPNNEDAMAGEISISLTVTDAYGASDSMVVTFEVLNVNDAPENVSFTGLLPGASVQTSKAYTLVGSAVDVDDAQEDLTYTWYAGTRLVGHGREFVWQPRDEGTVSLRLVVSDIAGDTAEFAVDVDVADPGDFTVSGGTLLALVVLSAIIALALGVYAGRPKT